MSNAVYESSVKSTSRDVDPMKRIFGILGKVAQLALPSLGPVGAIASSVVGGLVKTHTSTAGLPGILSGLTVGVGGNFTAGFLSGVGVSLYLSNHDFRAGINEAFGAAFGALKGVIF